MYKQTFPAQVEREALIRRDRKLKENPWAHIGADGNLDAVLIATQDDGQRRSEPLQTRIQQKLCPRRIKQHLFCKFPYPSIGTIAPS